MQDAEDFIQGMSYAQFISDKKRLNAVLRSIEVIGEAVKHVPANIRSKYPGVPLAYSLEEKLGRQVDLATFDAFRRTVRKPHRQALAASIQEDLIDVETPAG